MQLTKVILPLVKQSIRLIISFKETYSFSNEVIVSQSKYGAMLQGAEQKASCLLDQQADGNEGSVQCI